MAYSTIKDPSAHFQTVLWTGNNADTHAITNDGNSDLQPDWVWIKRRDYDNQPVLHDSSRGVTKFISTDRTDAEGTISPTTKFQSFDSDGFTTGSTSGAYNASGEPFVAWQWKANGGTTASNSDGNITATVQANPSAGFSIVTYTGNGVQTGKTVGHGLGAVPKMIISKDRGATSNVPNWRVYHEAIGNTKYLTLDTTAAAGTFNDWDNTTPTSSVYSVGGSGGYTPTNTNNTNYVAYVFAEVQGYSRFGEYTGNGNASGPCIWTGFKPAFVMLKRTNTTSNWVIMDNKRNTINEMETRLFANLPDAEQTQSTYGLDFLSNGFKLRDTVSQSNGSGSTYIYMAFAESPFTSSTGIPTTAR